EAAAIRGDRDAQAEVYEIYSEGLLGTSINKVKARQYLTYGVISPTQDMIDRWLSQGYALRDIGDLNEEYQENKQASMKLEQVMEACESLKRELVQSEEILDEEKDDIDYWADHVQSSTEYSRETAQLNYNINYQEYKDALYDYNRLIRDWNERCDKSEEDRRDPWFRE
ncbi:hypothetical protein, partial [Acinetobacter sp.]|uniref:hypothetical protein n=1 Tax=Acinetobacter sp. TaxID=472 RepID=UPI0035B149AC